MRLTETQFMSIWRCLYPDSRSGRIRSGLGQSLPASGMGAPAYRAQGQDQGQSGSSRAIVARADERATAMIALKRVALVVGLFALPLVGHADQVCDFEHRCYEDKSQQHYHMDLAHPDLETPPPAPQYPAPAPNAAQGRDVVVQPSACRLFRMRSVPNIEPLIVELCPVSPEEERPIRERANNPVGADVGQPVQ